MKRILAVALFAFAAAPAFAQPQPEVSPGCTGFAASPTLPDGATAAASAVADGNTTFRTWFEAGQAKLAQCRAEVEALNARYQASLNAHNAAADQLNSVRDAWQVEIDEYNGRAPDANSRRERGGVRTR
jgi:hypothetical protein